VIWGWPDGEDHGIALEQALQQTSIVKVVILVSDLDKPAAWQLGMKTIRVRKNSLPGVWQFLTAKYAFFSHPCFTRKYPPNVVSVNVWHGMPIKIIGSMLPGDGEMTCTYTTVTSPFWGAIMKRAMNTGGALPDIGLPRNDRLFINAEKTRQKIGLSLTQKFFVWLPTYRKSARGLPRTDGICAGNVFEMADVNPTQLNEWLVANNAIMIAKPHPMASKGDSQSLSNLWLIDNNWLNEKNVSLYEMLGASDCLLTDVSSVVIDYLLLDRPVIHTFADLEEYTTSRGFTISPIEDYLAGPVVTGMAGLLDTLGQLIAKKDLEPEKRKKLLALSHTYKDDKATERLMQLVGLKSAGSS
jgi:CDP-glycerol glycerophosphotransferase